MRYTKKSKTSIVLQEQWEYKKGNSAQNKKICIALLKEQKGFCAYSEKHIAPTSSPEVEHFDDRLKYKAEDSYYNWYAVTRWMNGHKAKIEGFLPLIQPYEAYKTDRISYEEGIFVVTEVGDAEAQNLIDFLGMNKHELYVERKNHVKKIKDILEALDGDKDMLEEHLKVYKTELSFATALEKELDIELESIINSLEY